MAICNPTIVFTQPGQPDSGTGPIPGFMEVISEWPTAIALDNLWSIEYDAPSNDLDICEPKEVDKQWEIGGATDIIKDVTREYDNWYKSNMIATSVKLIGENLRTARIGAANSEGYLRGIITEGREDFGSIDVAFIETNISYVDHVIRPWLITISKQSLIARKKADSNKRRNITCTLYGLTGPNKTPIPRKKFVYFNAFPTAVDAEEYNHTTAEVKIRQVSFCFTHYAMVDVGAENYPSGCAGE